MRWVSAQRGASACAACACPGWAQHANAPRLRFRRTFDCTSTKTFHCTCLVLLLPQRFVVTDDACFHEPELVGGSHPLLQREVRVLGEQGVQARSTRTGGPPKFSGSVLPPSRTHDRQRMKRPVRPPPRWVGHAARQQKGGGRAERFSREKTTLPLATAASEEASEEVAAGGGAVAAGSCCCRCCSRCN